MKMKKENSGGGGANWMDTYGDMVTLLLCFFVLLYSMSTISEENWKALVMSFNPEAIPTTTETSGGDGPVADAEDAGGETMIPESMSQQEIDESIEALFMALKDYAESSDQSESISVTKGDGKVFVTFKQNTFFDADSPELRPESLPILDSVSSMLSDASGAIDEVRILGHTAQANPNVRNTTKNDRTLSSNRATNVLIYIQDHSILDPARLMSVGMGQWQPVDTNDTPEGRANNRRVELIISGRNLEQELSGNIEGYSVGTESYSTSTSTTSTG